MNRSSEIPKGYRDTRIGLIPNDWELMRLGEALTLRRGRDLTNTERVPGKFPVISSSGYNGYHNVPAAIGPGLVMGRYGTLGQIYFVKEDFWPHNTTLYVSEFKQVSVSYAYYLLQSINYEAYSAKSAVPGLNRNDLHKELIAIPSIAEQEAIRNVLVIWDEAISKTQALLDSLRTRNKGLAKQLLTGRTRLKGFNDNWVHSSLGDYFNERKETGFEGLPLLSVGESGVYPQNESNKKDTSNSDKSKYKRICPGDIGYNTMRMWQGRSALSSLEGIVSPAYTIVTPKENANADYFAYLFKLDEIVHKFFRNSQGLVSDTLNCKFKDFKIVKVEVPPTIEEQQAVANALHKANQELRLYEKKLATLKEQKKGLMQKLLTGEVRVKT